MGAQHREGRRRFGDTLVSVVLCFLLAFPLLFVTVAPVRGEIGEKELNAITTAYGGDAAVKRLEAFRVEGMVSARLRGKQGSLRRDFRAPDKLAVEIAYPDNTEKRVLTAQGAWRGSVGEVVPVEGPPRLAMVYQLIRSTVPWSLVHFREKLEEEGIVERGDARFRVLALRWSAELLIRFLVNPETNRVERVEGSIGMGDRSIGFATGYSDFRFVEGVLVPFREDNFAAGRQTGTTTVSAVVFSPPDLEPFRPPGP